MARRCRPPEGLKVNAPPKRMTLQQIAKRAGVSTPTISKVLNGRRDVAPATRERILRVLHEQQYLPRGASTLPMAQRHIELVFDAMTEKWISKRPPTRSR